MEYRIRPAKRLDDYRPIFFEFGLIIVLLFFIVIARINFGAESKNSIKYKIVEHLAEEYHINELILISDPGVNNEISLPAPPRPRVAIEAPEDEIVEDLEFEFDRDPIRGIRIDASLPSFREIEPEEDIVFVAVQQLPELIGGLAALRDEISYPEIARRMGIEGRVFIQFIVSETGEVENPRIVRGIGGGCDEEVYDAIKKMRFRPGMQRGRPVRVQFTVSVLFRLYY